MVGGNKSIFYCPKCSSEEIAFQFTGNLKPNYKTIEELAKILKSKGISFILKCKMCGYKITSEEVKEKK